MESAPESWRISALLVLPGVLPSTCSEPGGGCWVLETIPNKTGLAQCQWLRAIAPSTSPVGAGNQPCTGPPLNHP